MNIIYNDETAAGPEFLEILGKAAELCVEKEGFSPDNMEISLTFVSGDEIRELNRNYRNVDRCTDVLSFPMIEDFNELETADDDTACDEDILLGDVVICLEQARRQAEEYGHSEKRCV